MLNQKLASANPLAAELAGYISSEVNRLSALVSDSWILRGPCKPRPVPWRSRKSGQGGASVQEQWRGAGVTVERALSKGFAAGTLDATLCEQVFVNLVQNAFEAMGEDGGTLRLEVAQREDGNRRGVEVRIQDSGPGISAELREQIFNPFVTTKSTGVGLGLSIVSQIWTSTTDPFACWTRAVGARGSGCFPALENSI